MESTSHVFRAPQEELELPHKQQKTIMVKNNIAPIKKLLMMLLVPALLALMGYIILLEENAFNQPSPLVPIVMFSFIAAPFVFYSSIAMWKDLETQIILTSENIIRKQPLSKEFHMIWNDIKQIAIAERKKRLIELRFTSNRDNHICCLFPGLSGDAANLMLEKIDLYKIPIKGKREHLERLLGAVDVESEKEVKMAGDLTLRSGNPALKADTFTRVSTVVSEDAMTISGTVNKTAFALLILIVAASWTWNLGIGDSRLWDLIWVGALGGFVVALVTVFKQTWAPYTTPVYAALEGLALGGISLGFELQYPGIVSQAVFLTFGTLGALLLAYRSGLIQPTENFKLGVVAATGGIAILYLVSFVVGMFGVTMPLIHSSGTFGILFSGFVVIIAALNLVLDFDFIEEGAARGAPKYMEWYGAFGLLVTLVWLYLEILHLLAKLQGDD